ncbi:MAG: membrane protein insertase YidC [Streptosporangiales bacterium]|nr:membrane protein insertase YidC [Streptosporangiales bacterium]
MLDVIGYPVSVLLWCWHHVFGFLLGDANALAWALAIVFLVFTVRAALVKPALAQARALPKMRQLTTRVAAIRKKYPDDRFRQTEELRKAQRELGVSPFGSILPLLLQVPAFLGLNQVLRAFTASPDAANYVFSLADVRSYLAATLLDVHFGDALLSLTSTGPGLVQATWLWQAAPVVIPLVLIATVATHLTARLAVTTQPMTGPQATMMRNLSLYVLPLSVLVFGAALPVGLLVYWVSSNVWMLGQQRLLSRVVDRSGH